METAVFIGSANGDYFSNNCCCLHGQIIQQIVLASSLCLEAIAVKITRQFGYAASVVNVDDWVLCAVYSVINSKSAGHNLDGKPQFLEQFLDLLEPLLYIAVSRYDFHFVSLPQLFWQSSVSF